MKKLLTLTAARLSAIPGGLFMTALFLLFNLLVVLPVAKFSRPVSGDFSNFVYFLSYRVEFMKRGLTGTLFDVFHIPVATPQLSVMFLVVANTWLFLLIRFFKMSLRQQPGYVFRWVIVCFIAAPFCAVNLGYDFLRTDVFLLAAEFAILCLLLQSYRPVYWLIPPLIVAAMLIHEAFLFLQLPVIAALVFIGFREKRLPAIFVLVNAAAVAAVLLFLFRYGTVSYSHAAVIYRSVYHRPMPANTFDHFAPIWVIYTSFGKNIDFTLRNYATVSFWKSLVAALPYIVSFTWIYFSVARIKTLAALHKLLVISPMMIFPMFLIGVDTYRWVNLLFINMTIVLAYLIQVKAVSLPRFRGGLAVALLIVVLHSFAGPIGGQGSMFPYPRTLLRKVKGAI